MTSAAQSGKSAGAAGAQDGVGTKEGGTKLSSFAIVGIVAGCLTFFIILYVIWFQWVSKSHGTHQLMTSAESEELRVWVKVMKMRMEPHVRTSKTDGIIVARLNVALSAMIRSSTNRPASASQRGIATKTRRDTISGPSMPRRIRIGNRTSAMIKKKRSSTLKRKMIDGGPSSA